MIQSLVFSRAKACGRLFAAAAAAILLGVISDAAHAQTWDHPHGDSGNTNFVDVVTAPAKKAPITVPGLGKFAHGTGPVIAQDGTVYLGTAGGKMIALRPDGSPLWSTDLPGRPGIVASPCLSANGTIYVVGVRHIRDNRDGQTVSRWQSTLYIVAANGVVEAQIPFPAVQSSERGVAAEAAPNIGRSGGTDVIMVPARYLSRFGSSLRLIAFATDGRVLANQLVKPGPSEVLGGGGGILPHYNPPDPVVFAPAPSLASVSVFTPAAGDPPVVMVSDQRKDLVAYTFNGQAFTEIFRIQQKGYFMRTPPMTPPNGYTEIGIQSIEVHQDGRETPSLYSRIQSVGPNGNSLPLSGELDILYAAPTHMSRGRVATVGTRGKISVLRTGQVVSTRQAPGGSIVSAAASRTHLFVSTQNAFLTYDADTMAELARIDWVGGGVNQPAIGPQGHVYAIASNILFVFPPPNQVPIGGTVAQPLDPTVDTNPNPAPAPDAKTFKDPMTANGNRLFACEELDQDDCGKGDYQTIATAFCKKQGFIGAGKVDVDSKKVKAETLDGRFCSKKKCKVFEAISCANN